MIKKISISNFQSHLKTVLNLDQFNAFIGPSSAGKTSAAVRATRFVLYGEWDKSWPNNPDKPTAVSFEFDDGEKVVRSRTGNKNKAAWFRDGKWEEPMKDFGAFVPGLFEKFNARPIRLDKKTVNLNYALQDDPPFMLTMPRPAKAQWLGRLYGAHAINNMMRMMAADKKTMDREAKRLREDLVPLEAKLEGLPDTAPLREGLRRMLGGVKLLKTLVSLNDREARLRGRQEVLDGHRELLNVNFDDLKLTLSEVAKLKVLLLKVEKFKESKKIVDASRELMLLPSATLRQDIETLVSLRTLRGRVLKVLAGKRVLRGSDELFSLKTEDLIEAISSVEGLKDLRRRRDSLDADAAVNGEKLKVADKELKRLQQAFKKSLLKDGKCPVCSSKPGKITAAQLAKNAQQILGAA